MKMPDIPNQELFAIVFYLEDGRLMTNMTLLGLQPLIVPAVGLVVGIYACLQHLWRSIY